jgi:hypothetical protein
MPLVMLFVLFITRGFLNLFVYLILKQGLNEGEELRLKSSSSIKTSDAIVLHYYEKFIEENFCLITFEFLEPFLS